MKTLTVERLTRYFEMQRDWEARYDFITDLGKRLDPLPPGARNDRNKVHGCVSNVWVTVRAQGDQPLLYYQADSDTSVVKGLVAMLVMLFSGKTPQEVQALDVDALFERLDLAEHLSPQRHVGMYAMVEKMRAMASDYADMPRAGNF
jgi:cysteine desulfuration protein SufE